MEVRPALQSPAAEAIEPAVMQQPGHEVAGSACARRLEGPREDRLALRRSDPPPQHLAPVPRASAPRATGPSGRALAASSARRSRLGLVEPAELLAGLAPR